MASDGKWFPAFQIACQILAKFAYTNLFRLHIAYSVYTIAYFQNRVEILRNSPAARARSQFVLWPDGNATTASNGSPRGNARLLDDYRGGNQRIYASHKSIMFSRQSCYFFVPSRRNSLELCIFLGRTLKAPQVRRVERVSKSKLAHFIRITHRDEVEPPITDWLREAYEFSNEPLTSDRASELEKAVAVKGRKRERPEKSQRLDGATEKPAAPESPLTDRVRAALSGKIDFQEKRMFGGVTFMVQGKMCISAGKNRIMCRIDPDVHDSALTREGCRTVIMKGRQYRGYVYVDEDALKLKASLTIGLIYRWSITASQPRPLGSGDRVTSAFTHDARD